MVLTNCCFPQGVVSQRQCSQATYRKRGDGLWLHHAQHHRCAVRVYRPSREDRTLALAYPSSTSQVCKHLCNISNVARMDLVVPRRLPCRQNQERKPWFCILELRHIAYLDQDVVFRDSRCRHLLVSFRRGVSLQTDGTSGGPDGER